MKVSVICIADRPERLPCLYWSLVAQTHKDWELIVLWQGSTAAIWVPPDAEYRVLMAIVPRIGDWGQSMKELHATTSARGGAFIFPNDDAYYVPIALEAMVGRIEAGIDLCICGWLYDELGYQALMPEIREGYIDIGCAMFRREAFLKAGWPNKGRTGDYELIKSVAEKGTTSLIPSVLYVKN